MGITHSYHGCFGWVVLYWEHLIIATTIQHWKERWLYEQNRNRNTPVKTTPVENAKSFEIEPKIFQGRELGAPDKFHEGQSFKHSTCLKGASKVKTPRARYENKTVTPRTCKHWWSKSSWRLWRRLRHQLKSYYWRISMWFFIKQLLLWRTCQFCEPFWPTGYRYLYSPTLPDLLHFGGKILVSNSPFKKTFAFCRYPIIR